MTTFLWLRRQFAHSFDSTTYPDWGFQDLVGVVPGDNVLRVIMRANLIGDKGTGLGTGDWAPATGQINHILQVFRGPLEDSRLATIPVPFQPTYVRNQQDTPARSFRASWAAPPVHVDIEARRTHSTGNQGNLDIGYAAQIILGSIRGTVQNLINPDVSLYCYVDVLTSRP